MDIENHSNTETYNVIITVITLDTGGGSNDA